MKANIALDAYPIMRTCYRTLSIPLYRTMKVITEGLQYNIWFNEIPIYRSDTLDKFFNWLETFGKEWMNEWSCFDYYIYAAYLLTQENWQIKKYSEILSNFGAIESADGRSCEEYKHVLEIMESHWSADKSIVTSHTCMFCQLDRKEREDDSVKPVTPQRLNISKLQRTKLLRYDNIYDSIPGISYLIKLYKLLK